MGKMMSYEAFKAAITEDVKKYLPARLQSMEVFVEPVRKVNCLLEELVLRGGTGEITCGVAIDVKKLYDDLLSGIPYEEICQRAAKKLAVDPSCIEAVKQAAELAAGQMDIIRDQLFLELINTEKNRALLQKVPHREFLDLSVIYRMSLSSDEQGVSASTVLTGTLAERLGFSEEELYSIAYANTGRLRRPVVYGMGEVLQMFDDTGRLALEEDHGLQLNTATEILWILTNAQQTFGAASVLYGDVLHDIAEQLQSDFYILPCSIHECILLRKESEEDFTPQELREMVAGANLDVVSDEEYLSDSVYYYDSECGEVRIAEE